MSDAPAPPAPVLAELAGDELFEGGFSRRALAWIIGSVAVSFVAAILLGVYGKDLDRRPNVRATTFSDSALGYHALEEWLHEVGILVRSREAPGGGIGPRVPLILAEPDDADAFRLQALRDEAKTQGAPLVLVLSKWRPGPARKDKPKWLARVDLQSDKEILRRVRSLGMDELDGLSLMRASGKARCGASSGDPLAVDIPAMQLFRALAGGLVPLVGCEGGVLVAWRRATEQSPQLVLISDPDLLNNHGLERGDNATVVYDLLTGPLAATGVVFDETIHGFHRTQGLLAEALRFPMVLAVLQGLVLLAVILWAGMGRFGKPLPPPPALAAGKQVLIDNTSQVLASGGHAADCLARFFRQTTRAVAAHYSLPPEMPDRERLARLQRFTDARGASLSLAELERDARQLPKGRPGEKWAAAIARRLYDWRVEMTNGHRESP